MGCPSPLRMAVPPTLHHTTPWCHCPHHNPYRWAANLPCSDDPLRPWRTSLLCLGGWGRGRVLASLLCCCSPALPPQTHQTHVPPCSVRVSWGPQVSTHTLCHGHTHTVPPHLCYSVSIPHPQTQLLPSRKFSSPCKRSGVFSALPDAALPTFWEGLTSPGRDHKHLPSSPRHCS